MRRFGISALSGAILAPSCFFAPEAQAVSWAPNSAYTCKISAAPIDFGLIEDFQLNHKKLPTQIVVDCTREALTGPITGGFYCIVIGGNSADGAWSPVRVLNNKSGGSGQIYFSFYDTGDANLPVGGSFTDNGGIIFGAISPSISDNFFGSFSTKIPVQAGLFDSRVNKGDGSISGGLYANNFFAEMRYGGYQDWPFKPKLGKKDCATLPQGAGANIRVQATVKSSCAISVKDKIDFGTMPDYQLAFGNSAAGAVDAVCSGGIPYQIGIDEGRHGGKAGSGGRAMEKAGSGEFIAYDLYRDSSHIMPWTDKWGTDGVLKSTGSGTHDSYAVYGFVPPQEGDKSPGMYQDTVVVEIRINMP